MTPALKAEQFRSLHQDGCFTLPNAWDAGSARLLASLGFPAIATTSAGLAFMLGRQDGVAVVSRTDALANAGDVVAATDLPVSADLEDGYGPTPEDCATTVRMAAAAGLCGCTIEDTTADPASPIHSFERAVARVRAAALAAQAAPTPFVLTARAENFLHGRPDIDDTVRRLVAFAEAGADFLYAPALPDLAAIRTVVAAVAPRPVNVLIGPRDGLLSAERLAEAGVRRISIGGALARAAYGEMLLLGSAFGFSVIAEGVETEEQADRLRLKGCEEVQGYLFGRPMPASDFAAHFGFCSLNIAASSHPDYAVKQNEGLLLEAD